MKPRMIYATTKELNSYDENRFALVKETDGSLIMWRHNGQCLLFGGSTTGLLARHMVVPVSIELPELWDNYSLEQFIPSYLLPKEVNASG